MYQEGHVLVSRKACSRMLKGLSLSVEGHGQDGRGTKIVYRFSVMSWREEDRRASSSCLERGDKRKEGVSKLIHPLFYSSFTLSTT